MSGTMPALVRATSASIRLVSIPRMVRRIVGTVSPPLPTTLLLPTLYFVRSGYIGLLSDNFNSAGVAGYQWSSLASARRFTDSMIDSAYYFGFYGDGINPNNGPDYRWYSYPLRCQTQLVKPLQVQVILAPVILSEKQANKTFSAAKGVGNPALPWPARHVDKNTEE